MADQTSSLIVRLIDQVTGPAKAVGRAIAGIGRSAKGASGVTMSDRLNAAQARLNTRMAGYRMQMVDAMAVTYAFARALKRPIDAAREFETQLTEIGNKSGMSKAQLTEFGKTVAGLSKETNQFTKDLLTGADILIGFGMDASTAAKAIGTIGKTATATGASIEDLSRLGTASIMNLKVPVEQLELAFDKLAYAGKAGGFELKDMAAYFPELGAAFATFGQEGVGAVTDLGAALQIVRRSTGDGAQAANALANLLQKARAPLTVKKFGEYGVDIRKELEKGIAAGKSPFDVLVEQFKKAQKKGAILEDIFSDKQVQEAMRPLLQFYDDYVKLREEAGKASGIVLDDFFKKMETNAERMKAFQITMDNLALSIGNALLPALTEIMAKITPVVEAFGRWAENNPKLVAGITAVVAGLLAFNMAAIALKYTGGFAYGAFLSLAKGVLTVSGAFTTLAGAIAMTGIGAIVIGIALAGLWIYNNWKGLSQMFDAFGASFKAALGPEATAALSTVIGWVETLWGWIQKLTGPMDYTEAQWRRIGFVAGQQIGNIVNKIMNLPETIRTAASNIGGYFEAAFRNMGMNLGASIAEIKYKVKSFLDGFVQDANAKLTEWEAMGAALGNMVVEGIKSAFNDLMAWFAGLPSRILAAIGSIDLSGILKWPSMPTWLGGSGGGEAAPAAEPLKGQAKGGPVSSRPYLVGERGPEIFKPSTSGTIIPNKALGGGGGTTISPTFNIAINGNADANTVENIRRVLRDEVRQAFRGVYADAGMRFA